MMNSMGHTEPDVRVLMIGWISSSYWRGRKGKVALWLQRASERSLMSRFQRHSPSSSCCSHPCTACARALMHALPWSHWIFRVCLHYIAMKVCNYLHRISNDCIYPCDMQNFSKLKWPAFNVNGGCPQHLGQWFIQHSFNFLRSFSDML